MCCILNASTKHLSAKSISQLTELKLYRRRFGVNSCGIIGLQLPEGSRLTGLSYAEDNSILLAVVLFLPLLRVESQLLSPLMCICEDFFVALVPVVFCG